MSDPKGPLATLHDPSPEEASRWYKPRKKPVKARLKLLAEFLVEDPTIRFTKKTTGGGELFVDTGDGTSLRLTIAGESIEVRVGPAVLRPDQGRIKHAKYVEMISEFIEVLQVGSGFYVYSDELVGFDPCGACPKCGIEVFEWQDACEICDAKLYPPRPGEDEHDARAQRVVEVLLRRTMIELTSPRGRRNVEKTVSMFYAYGSTNPEALLTLFMEMDDVAEVYCEEEELETVLVRIK